MTTPINNSTNALINSLQTSSSAATSGSSASGMSALANANSFYNLLVTQLTNQDPLNPMSNSDLSAQMAQFSTASGVQSIQQSMAALTAQLAQSQGLQAANLVGHTVVFDSNSMSLGTSGGSAGGFTLSGAASDVQVQVLDSAGQTVDTVDLGALPAGVQSFSWDGKNTNGQQAAAGNYTFNVQAVDASGKAVGATPFGTGTVQAVLLGGSNGASLQIQGQNSSVPLSNIQGVV
jgi:flagellar basal-body rod modification protein FlgD